MKKILAAIVLAISVILPAEASTLGIRNNNPGNILKSSIHWQGEIKCNSRFECFDTPENGLRAMALNLLSAYHRHDKKTGAAILKRWSPPHENNLKALHKVFYQHTGLSPYEQLDFSDYEVFKTVMNALIVQENGRNPYISKMDKTLLRITKYNMNIAWMESTYKKSTDKPMLALAPPVVTLVSSYRDPAYDYNGYRLASESSRGSALGIGL